MDKYCILAGNGLLPILMITELVKKNKNFIIIALNNENQDEIRAYYLDLIGNLNNFFDLNICEISKIKNIIKKNGISRVIMCGGVKFPGIKNLQIKFFDLMRFGICYIKLKIGNKGDNFLFKTIESVFKKENIELVGVHEILPEILAKMEDSINGNLFNCSYQKDLDFASKILETLSDFDIGQAIIVQNGRILGIEGPEGTDELIKRCSNYIIKKDRGAILVKSIKKNQILKVDLPTIGLQTIENLIKYNFSGLCIKANSTIILNKEEIKSKIENNKEFFLYVFK